MRAQDLASFLYERKLPQIYRDEDSKIGYPLKRYIESLSSGFTGVIEDIDNIMLLIDPNTVPKEFFPYLCESFGLDYFPDIDVIYQRKFISNIGELVKRRGTFSSVHFLIRALTGLESELSLKDNTLTITLLPKTLMQISLIEPSIKVVGNYIRTQIPYYINPKLESNVSVQIIPTKSYSVSAIASVKKYKLPTFKEGI